MSTANFSDLDFNDVFAKDVSHITTIDVKNIFNEPILDLIEVSYVNLTTLIVSNCKLQSLDIDSHYTLCDRKFPNLKHADFSCNELTHLPESIANWSSLEILDLHDNKFDELPYAIMQLKLKKIIIHGNPLRSLDPVIKQFIDGVNSLNCP